MTVHNVVGKFDFEAEFVTQHHDASNVEISRRNNLFQRLNGFISGRPKERLLAFSSVLVTHDKMNGFCVLNRRDLNSPYQKVSI